ncbi:MAG: glycosyltransferase [Bacteroidaceae bacterium]|nr:glycosyltransferase [Bacteroidaceae bacterium]
MPDTQPLFSIVTVCYNASSEIMRTIESVDSQDFDSLEHIFIDGASKDDTLSIIRQYAERARHTVTFASEKDRGIYDAMNKAFDGRVHGRYIMFLNAGDTLKGSDTLSQIAELVSADSEPGVIYGYTEVLDEKGNYLGMRRKNIPENLNWKSFKNGMLVCHQAFIVNQRLFCKYNLKYKYSADVDWCIRIMKEAEKQGLEIKGTKTTISQFYTGGATTQHHTESLIERFKVMTDHYGLCSTVWHHLLFAVRGITKKIS